MRTSIVSSLEIRKEIKRIDANYHLSEGVDTERKLSRSPYPLRALRYLCDRIFNGGRYKRVYVQSEKNGVQLLGITEVLKSGNSSSKLISRKFTKSSELLKVQKGWILVARSGSGAIGTASLATEDFENKIISEDLLRIVPRNDVMEGFLYAFLASAPGYHLLQKGIYGSAIPHIEPEYAERIQVPIFPELKQSEIHGLIVEASDLRVQSNKLLRKAHKLFDTSNNLEYHEGLLAMSENAIQLGYSVAMSNMFKITFKARNHSLRAQRLASYWETKAGVPLTDYLETPFQIGTRASFKRINASNFKGCDLVSQSDIHRQNPKNFKQVKPKRIREEDMAQRNCLIMPSAGTLGENEIFTRPLLVRENFEGKLLSEVIGRFKCKSETDAGYLYVALSSIAGFRILRAMVYGTNLLYPNWELIKHVRIPIKNERVKSTIGQLVLDAFDKRGQADRLENKAISLVENEIDSWQR